ncbi:serine/threonine protein kinase [Streptomyces roseoverticillatus]|uniref:serine/threonine-protein kinase n=1 Tax=Streptomyces roseoverticillatus TaxID=66429 RepID=UPI001F412CAD|nr:serine/threonine-protein kinase [Streptomyces roseoverticillatus]MCF3103894.1 serine/threonine protein kinase [Streptomyces roseoverticillatus]
MPGQAVSGPWQDHGRLVAGRYRLVDRIGRGGMGTVWRAQDELLDRQVALKQLHVSPYLDDDELATLYERTRREARSAARITHPNVVVVHDVVDDHGLPCIVMEYVPSKTLGDVLKHGTITPEEAARIGRGMIAALRAAHAAGVLHRDVKPGNVLLGDDGRVVLTDFGIAQSTGTSTLTKTGEMVGSIDYIAPERVKGAKPGPASDLWALGATLYQALEGRPPFRKDTAVETAYAIAIDPLEPPRNAGELTRLIETLLAKDPAVRPPADLAEQILREPAAEADTAHMSAASVPEPRPAAPVTAPWDDRPDRGTMTATAATAPTAAAVPAATPAASTELTAPTKAAAPAAPAAATATGRSRRPVLWSALALVTVAGLAAGAFFLTRGQADDDTSTQAAPGRDASAQPSGKASPSAAPKPPPAGYHLVTEKEAGISFPVPDGWKRDKLKDSDEILYVDPSGLVGLRVSVLDLASSDPLQRWKDDEAKSLREGKLPGYTQLRMQSTEYRGMPAAVWEFSWKGRAREYRAADLGFGRPGEKEYAIYLSAPKADWHKHSPVFDAVREGFRSDAR